MGDGIGPPPFSLASAQDVITSKMTNPRAGGDSDRDSIERSACGSGILGGSRAGRPNYTPRLGLGLPASIRENARLLATDPASSNDQGLEGTLLPSINHLTGWLPDGR